MDTMSIIGLTVVTGATIGFAVSVGAARMFRAPETQGLGAFRTLGEINSCNGDPASHFALGLGFYINSAATAVGTGALTQDILHRVIPNWAFAIFKLKHKGKTLDDMSYFPFQLGIIGAIVGTIVMPSIVLLYSFVPIEFSKVAGEVLAPAAKLLFNPIMPILFLLAAFDSSKKTGIWALVLAAFSQVLMTNPLPGVILGIMLGEAASDQGYKSKTFIILISIISIIMLVIGVLRGVTFDTLFKFAETVGG
ncbi:MAG: DUF4311 domain-containing protein [Mycoplasmatales bacterium]